MPMKKTLFVLLILSSFNAYSQPLNSSNFNIGTPSVTDYYVDPSSGDDDNQGTSRSSPKRTVTDIWNSIRENSSLATGVRINLLPGTYSTDHLPNYWENRRGTNTAPIILQAADGYGTVKLSRDINMANVSYFYLLEVEIKNRTTEGYGDAFHCENCDHILLRGNSFNGAPNGRSGSGDVAHETIKFNQSQYIYIENNNIQGADDNGIDWVSVQYGHIRGNRIHDTQGWCAYVKGGSSYILIESNIAYDCGEGGITAGQGTGFEFMESPWLRYEANYIKIVNNVIYNIEGAALGINGGFDVLVAHNTAYRVGSRSHLIEVVFGERSCDGDTSACQSRRSDGGWGPAQTGSENSQPIGNRGVTIANNVIYNPSGFTSGSQHLAVYGPRNPTASGIPSPQRTDTGLRIIGNVIWNGTPSMPLGIGDGQGCLSSNSTCNEIQLLADNRFNSTEPDFVDGASHDFRPGSVGTLAGISSATIPDFDAIDTSHNPIPEGDRSNTMVREFSGAEITTRPPGAFASNSSSVEFPTPGDGGGSTPGDGGGNPEAPTIRSLKGSATGNKKSISLKFSANITDSSGIQSVNVSIDTTKGAHLGDSTMTQSGGKYKGKAKVKSKAKKVKLTVTATDTSGHSALSSKTLKVAR